MKRYRNPHFTVEKPPGQEISRGGISLQWLIFRKKQSNINPRLAWGTLDAWEEQREELLSSSCSSTPLLSPSLCHLTLLIAALPATLQPCLQASQGEGSWSVTPTCSTSINLLVKHQGSFTSVMTFYFITQHAVHEAAFPQCLNLVREKTPFSPLLCHQCLPEIREHLEMLPLPKFWMIRK